MQPFPGTLTKKAEKWEENLGPSTLSQSLLAGKAKQESKWQESAENVIYSAFFFRYHREENTGRENKISFKEGDVGNGKEEEDHEDHGDGNDSKDCSENKGNVTIEIAQ